jgi:hypothetical protein
LELKFVLFPVLTSLLDVPLGQGDGAGHVLMKKMLLVADAAFQVDFCERSMPQSEMIARFASTATVTLLLFEYVHGLSPVILTTVLVLHAPDSTKVRAAVHAVGPENGTTLYPALIQFVLSVAVYVICGKGWVGGLGDTVLAYEVPATETPLIVVPAVALLLIDPLPPMNEVDEMTLPEMVVGLAIVTPPLAQRFPWMFELFEIDAAPYGT